MMVNNIISTLLISILLNNIINTEVVFAYDKNINEQNTISMSEKKLSVYEKAVNSYGFMAYIYSDDKFKNLESIKFNIYSNNLINNNKVNSAKFIGYFKPSESKSYSFTTSNNENCVLKVNNKILVGNGKFESIELEKDKLYPLELDVFGGIVDFGLFLIGASGNNQVICKENILLPNLSNPTLPVLIESSFSDNSINEVSEGNIENNNIKDSDRDGIPDEWELNGYAFKNNEIIPWSDNIESEGYKKYVSNPYEAKTANDPYTDMQKVIGQIPSATKFEARDPMIAAFPKISVGMENLLIDNNENVTEGVSGAKTVSTTKIDTTTHGVNINTEIGFSNKLFSFTFSPSYSYTNTTSTQIEDTSTESWSKEIGINTSEAAYLNANIRYYNTGTAPIYEVTPTTNFILKNSGQSIATIKAGPNQIGNSIAPNKSYPEKGLAPISLNKANEFGTVNISISSNTLDDIQSGKEIINLETSQFNGQYAIIDSNGNFVTNYKQKWAPIITEIEQNSANIIIKTPTNISERYIATRNPKDKNDKTPILSIKQALIKAYNLEEINGILYYEDESSGKNYSISSRTIEIICDENTKNLIESKLQESNKDILDLNIEKGMNFTIILPEFYDDFTNNNLWDNVSSQTNPTAGVIPANYQARYNGKLKIEPHTDYIFKLYVNPTSSSSMFSINIKDNDTGESITNKGFFYPEVNKDSFIYLGFNSYGFNSNNVTIIISNGDGNLLIKDMSLTKLRKNNIKGDEPNNVIKVERQIAPKKNNSKVVTVDIVSSSPDNVNI